MFKSIAIKGINLIESVHEALVNHPFVVHQAKLVLANAIKVTAVWAEVTYHEVRLYSLEGKHLSRKRGEMRRMTWYTNPLTAKELGEYMGGLTGRLVYIDIPINIMSPYSHRFYKRGDEAFILQDDLIDRAKRSWKYAPTNTLEIAVGRE